VVLNFLLIFTGVQLSAEPFLAPHDNFLRHEIRLLQDNGSLNSTLNSWPINLGGLSLENKIGDWEHSLLENTISRESELGWSPLITKIGIADDRVIARSFGNEPRGGFTTGLESSWMNNRFAARLSLYSFYGVEPDWKGRKKDGLVLDGSYFATRLGNWSASLGQVDPDSMVNWNVSGELVFITIMSGSGNILAPFIGAILFEFIRTYAFEWAPQAWQAIVGGTLLAIIFFFPGGIWSVIEKVFNYGKKKNVK